MVDFAKYIDEQYSRISDNRDKQNYQLLYNIIHIKKKFNCLNYNESLYLDAKKFAISYINAIDNEDFGYDQIQLSKIKEVADCLEIKQKLFFLYNIKRLLQLKGYDVDNLSKEIMRTEMFVAKIEKHWLKYIRLWISSSFIKLVLIYLVYIVFVGIILLPAPFSWMSLFDITMRDYSTNSFLNHCANTLALISGNESISPQIIPNGILGMIIYCFGIALFYLFFINYLFRKIEDYIKIA